MKIIIIIIIIIIRDIRTVMVIRYFVFIGGCLTIWMWEFGLRYPSFLSPLIT